jgi:signal transduction histidine kinase
MTACGGRRPVRKAVGDATQIRQVVMKLCTNTMEAMPETGEQLPCHD